MSTSLWSRSSSGWAVSASRALCWRPSVYASQFLTCRRAYAAAALAPERRTTSSEPAPIPFASLQGKISKQTLDAITVKPFRLETMSPVQAEVLPMLPALAEPYDPKDMDNVRDLLVRAKTGTGKTLGFLVPAIEARVKSIQQYLDGPHDTANAATALRRFTRRTVGTLVISPTRELATQIANEALKLVHHHTEFEVRLFTGGTSKRLQMRDWMKGRKDIVVSTPGRLRDLLESEPDVRSAIAETSVLVLDEADTLLEMGFREDIEEIKRFLPPTPQRQTLLFSATVSQEIQQIARSTLAPNHKYINCVSNDSSPVHAHVPQFHTILPSASAQLPHIMRLIAHDQLTNPGNSKVIIFFPTTKMTQLFSTMIDVLATTVLPAGRSTRIFEIHSKRTQDKRTQVSNLFRVAKGSSVLITSDVSARGVDYPGVTRVIQVGIPSGREHYIHRVGRTGRAGTSGRGDLVLLPWEIGFVTWQLTDVPLKPLTTNELTAQITQLAQQFDDDPKGYLEKLKSPLGPGLFGARPVASTVNEIEPSIGALIPRLDEAAINETFLSLIGYYIAKSPELRVQKPVIVQGCQDWTTGACGLASPPYVSAGLLQKLGMGDGRTKHFGKARELMPRRDRPLDAPWMGRGKTSKSKVRDKAPQWASVEQPEENVDVSEYRTSRYEMRGNGYRKPPQRRNGRPEWSRDGGY